MRNAARWLIAASLNLATPALADDTVISVSIHDHVFIPSEIHVPAAKPVFLEITNTDATAEEFDSGILGIEKVIPPGGKVRIRLRPLGAGTYKFVGEYHEATAHGIIIAEPGK